ncbi:MAG: STAS/SEC14 domain-containing protein [Reyranella sp.]|nr:STAS/SEC14 domain-containing protein [Reyranella sp.]
MPMRWTIQHPEKFVHIVAEGAVTLKEMEEHFDALLVADAMPYAKLFDATNADPIYSDEDVMTMGARLSAYTATVASGPLAVVGLSDHVEITFRRFVNVSPSKRPARLFKTEAQARAWLATQTTP